MSRDFPVIRTVGLSGLLITFAEKLSEPANRAALAFRAAVEAEEWPEVTETSTSLVSTFLAVDLASTPLEAMQERLATLLQGQSWQDAPLPPGRTLWHVPTLYGTDLAPQLEEAAEAAGLDPQQAIKEISGARVRVLTIGFAPGQPYLGELDEHWNLPRQKGLTPNVPASALVVAVRQLVVFTNDTPTGWRHIGQTAFKTFRPWSEEPFALSPGDEMTFPEISRSEYDRILETNSSGDGGADRELLT